MGIEKRFDEFNEVKVEDTIIILPEIILFTPFMLGAFKCLEALIDTVLYAHETFKKQCKAEIWRC